MPPSPRRSRRAPLLSFRACWLTGVFARSRIVNLAVGVIMILGGLSQYFYDPYGLYVVLVLPASSFSPSGPPPATALPQIMVALADTTGELTMVRKNSQGAILGSYIIIFGLSKRHTPLPGGIKLGT